MKISWNKAGLICFSIGEEGWDYSLHLFVKPEFWIWGHVEDYYDGPLHRFGLGPLFLLAWFDWT